MPNGPRYLAVVRVSARSVSLVLLLATSCPRKAVVLELSPPAADSTRNPRAEVVALVGRLAARHEFAKSVTMDGVECTATWRRPAGREGYAGYDAWLCAQYAETGPMRLRLYDNVPMNHDWTPSTDSLRRELVDSLGQWGKLKVSKP